MFINFNQNKLSNKSKYLNQFFIIDFLTFDDDYFLSMIEFPLPPYLPRTFANFLFSIIIQTAVNTQINPTIIKNIYTKKYPPLNLFDA